MKVDERVDFELAVEVDHIRRDIRDFSELRADFPAERLGERYRGALKELAREPAFQALIGEAVDALCGPSFLKRWRGRLVALFRGGDA